MNKNIYLEPLKVPEGTKVPGGIDSLISLIAQHLQISGTDEMTGFKASPVPPDADNEGAIWLETNSLNEPLSLKLFDGSSWRDLPFKVPFGPTDQRPQAPNAGTKFFDTTIEQELVFVNNEWKTAWGGKGQRIFVVAASQEEAEARYPGWIADREAMGLFIRGASPSLDAGTRGGGEQVRLEEANLPPHTHTALKVANKPRNGDDDSIIDGIDRTDRLGETGITGQGKPFDIPPPPFFAMWILKRT